MKPGERCYAIVGTAFTGPMYCGSPAKRVDANGRPLCNRKHSDCEQLCWDEQHGRYPHGPNDYRGERPWKFQNGPARI